MKTLKSILLVLFMCSVGYAADSKSPVVIFQEGVYAEKTEGDISKAIDLYQQVLVEAKEVKRLAARATFQLGICHLKLEQNDKAADYFLRVVKDYPQQQSLVKRAKSQLDKLGWKKDTEENLFEILDDEVGLFIGNKYGSVCAQAGMKRLYSNGHIYAVDKNFIMHKGGMGYVWNYSGEPITERHRIGGTSMPDQTLYSVYGDEMDVDIVPDENRSNFYHIYWNPKEPLNNGEFFNYGWVLNKSTELYNSGPGTSYPLTMQNHLGSEGYETFFLAVPEDFALVSQDREYTGMKNLKGWDIYWWTRQVPENTDNVVNVSLKQTAEKSLLEIIPDGVQQYCVSTTKASFEYALLEGYKYNAHIYLVDEDFTLTFGGMSIIHNHTHKNIETETPLSSYDDPDLTVFDQFGVRQKVRMIKKDGSGGNYRMYWTPSSPVTPGKGRGLIRTLNKTRKLVKEFGGDSYHLTMQNTYGVPVIEDFILVMPYNVSIKSKSLEETEVKKIGKYKIVRWNITNDKGDLNRVQIAIAESRVDDPDIVSDIVKEVVLTISTCAETDPRLAAALEKLKTVDQKIALKHVNKYLLSEKPTVRRSAIYVSRHGGFEDVSLCLDNLRKLCAHEENTTRGMAALALGAAKDAGSFDTICKITLEDKSAYTRRCGAYALGLMGDKRALKTLEKALEDSNQLVKQNAEAAIILLTELEE